MTRIDRYILTLFLRTVLISFLSLAGVFVVFQAFTSMDDLIEQAREGDGMLWILIQYFGPYMLLLFDWTGAIVTLMALLFTVGLLRRTGELTAILAAGVSHGRLLRPVIIATAGIILVQLANRELLLYRFGDSMSMKAKNLGGDFEQAVRPKYDRQIGVLFAGRTLNAKAGEIYGPNFTIHGDYPGFADVLRADSAIWMEAEADRPCGYLLHGVERPQRIDSLSSVIVDGRPVLLTSYDQDWLQPKECFIATTVGIDLLETNETAMKTASVAELARQVRNPAVHSSASLHVYLHERIIRPPLDFALCMLALPLVVNRRGRGLFVLVGVAVGIVLAFFGIKTAAGMMGSNGYLLTPAMAAWVPLLVLGPIAYVRLREVQAV